MIIDKLLNSIPIIEYLDHLILVPIGVALAFEKMIPPAVLTDCREKARYNHESKESYNWVDASSIIFVWFLFASLAIVPTI
jgi:predicted tellurium resistance membrane protein TerC